MKVLFDTNVVLDVLLDREPFAPVSMRLFSKVEAGEIGGWICATTVTTIHYLASKEIGAVRARGAVETLLSLFEVASVNRVVLESALRSGFDDFEDAVIHEAARHVVADAIITRDVHGFERATLRVYAPMEFEKALSAL